MRKIKKTLAVSLALMLTVSLYPGNVKAAEIDDTEAVVVAEEIEAEVVEPETEVDEAITNTEDVAAEEDVIDEEEEVVEVNPSDKISFTATNFPDAAFRDYLKTNFSGKKYSEVTSISVTYKEIKSVKGIELFPNLEDLNVGGNKLTSIDVSKNTKLTSLFLWENQITALDVSNCPELTSINNMYNPVKVLNLSNNKKLKGLNCYSNELTSLDLSNCPELGYLDCGSNKLTQLDVSGLSNLENLECCYNEISSLNLRNAPKLRYLRCSENKLKELDLTANTKLIDIFCGTNNIKTIDVSKLSQLVYFEVQNNKLTQLDTSNNPELKWIHANGNYLTSIDVSKNPMLERLEVAYNRLTTLDISKNTNLHHLSCYSNGISTIDISKNYLLGTLDGPGNSGELRVGENTSILIPGAKSIKSSKSDVVTISGTTVVPNKVPDNWLYKETTLTFTLNGKNLSIPLVVEKRVWSGIEKEALIVNEANKDHILAEMYCEWKDMSELEYSFYASTTPDDPDSFVSIRNWSSNNKLDWTPDTFGEYTIIGKARFIGNNLSEVYDSYKYVYHPAIKGNCQMPYGMIAPGEPGYLIGLETYPGTADSVEMLILDCTTMMWTYSTGKNLVPENMLWTVWQPQYGYYWTLFRAYDKNGKLIDEVCYGFVNAY